MSADWRILRDVNSGVVILPRVRLCISHWCHFRGLQLVRHLPDDEGLLFVRDAEGVSSTAIHMFFMFFSIAVVWLDAKGKIVDKQLAIPWRPLYSPRKAAQYYLEANPFLLEKIEIGDVLRFDEITE
jgi:uncharacterized membrane protein (UPF0127 family)